jgi:hypothetical protein
MQIGKERASKICALHYSFTLLLLILLKEVKRSLGMWTYFVKTVFVTKVKLLMSVTVASCLSELTEARSTGHENSWVPFHFCAMLHGGHTGEGRTD